MKIFPAIDIYEGAAVRLFKGDYKKLTVYNKNPQNVVEAFENKGASCIHIVDLEGAKNGGTPNLSTIKNIVENTNLFSEVGGGIRSMETIEKYLSIGVGRVILGTAAVTEEGFAEKAVLKYGDRIAVGVDIKDERVAIKGWTEKSDFSCDDFCMKMQKIGVKTLICTDISKDGAMEGTNLELYKNLSEKFRLDIIASGGISTIDDIKKLTKMNVYGAIIGKAYYTGAINLAEAIRVSAGKTE